MSKLIAPILVVIGVVHLVQSFYSSGLAEDVHLIASSTYLLLSSLYFRND